MRQIGYRDVGACVVTLSLMLLLSSPALAGPLDVQHPRDSTVSFRTTAEHGIVVLDDFHPFFTTNTNWFRQGSIVETLVHPNFGSSTLLISGDAHHVVAPHGEGVGSTFNFIFNVVANQHLGKTSATPSVRQSFAHESHFDHFHARTSFSVDAIGRIESYLLFIEGKHTDTPTLTSRDGNFTSGLQVPPVTSNAHGLTNIFIDPTTGLFDLSIAALGITPAELTGAAIHLGGPGQVGPAIFDLNTSSFTGLGSNGLQRDILDGQFPMQYLQALLDGQTYINLSTAANPDGEIRAQLVPEPSTFVLGALSMLGLGLIARRNKNRRV